MIAAVSRFITTSSDLNHLIFSNLEYQDVLSISITCNALQAETSQHLRWHRDTEIRNLFLLTILSQLPHFSNVPKLPPEKVVLVHSSLSKILVPDALATLKNVTHPVMWGKFNDDRPFVVLCYQVMDENGNPAIIQDDLSDAPPIAALFSEDLTRTTHTPQIEIYFQNRPITPASPYHPIRAATSKKGHKYDQSEVALTGKYDFFINDKRWMQTPSSRTAFQRIQALLQNQSVPVIDFKKSTRVIRLHTSSAKNSQTEWVDPTSSASCPHSSCAR